MIDRFLHHIDQLDRPPTDGDRKHAEKLAETLNERREALKTASHDDFAVVLFNGHDHRRKFPVQTETDIRMSKEALSENRERLPDEVVETAEYFLDQAAREKLATALYEDRPDAKNTNIVYVGEIDREAWREKQARLRESDDDTATLDLGAIAVPIETEDHVKKAERMLHHGMGLSNDERCRACRTLADRARSLNASLASEKVARYDRSALPVQFEDFVDIRRDRAPAKMRPLYDDLKKKAEAMPLPRVARTLESLDKVAGLAPMDGEKMASRMRPTAYDVVFPAEEPKQATQDLSKVAALFGDEFVERYKRNGEEVLQSLTPSEQRLVRDALQSPE